MDNLKTQREIHANCKFGSEEMTKRGKDRLEGSFETLKVHGVTGTSKVQPGTNKVQPKVQSTFILFTLY